MEKKECEYVEIDGNNYIILKSIENYVYLVNSNDIDDFFIQKVVLEDGKEYFVNLDSEEEFDKALNLFDESNKNVIK